MLFQCGPASLKLEIVNYEVPADAWEASSEDRNWLVLRCTWVDEDGNVVKDSNGCLLAQELVEMTAGLKILNAGIRSSYASEFQQPYFTLDARSAGEGFLVNVSFYLPNTMDGDDTAELEAPVTKAEMKALIAELDRLCERYPERK